MIARKGYGRLLVSKLAFHPLHKIVELRRSLSGWRQRGLAIACVLIKGAATGGETKRRLRSRLLHGLSPHELISVRRPDAARRLCYLRRPLLLQYAHILQGRHNIVHRVAKW